VKQKLVASMFTAAKITSTTFQLLPNQLLIGSSGMQDHPQA
jgi:hypothetical protein